MQEPPPRDLVESLKSRYQILGQLGQGGMATVYLARDEKHDREVALKVLRPELASALGSERFLREIKLLAKLHHPHILALHDSGEAAGHLFYVMPYVEGESLADRLTREGELPIDEALGIARDVADALSYAHAAGVVHRDIKRANIMLQAGHAIVADFGIASVVGGMGEERLTQTGLAIGTPAYMSPEQSAGESNLDGRSDIYALASVLYEMLIGEPPYTGPSAQAIIARRLSEEVPSVRVVRETVPDHVERTIEARVLNLAGLSVMLLAENFCSGVPFSRVNADGSFDFGQPLTTSMMLDSALALFGSALQLAQSAGSSEQTNLAMMGEARILLDQGSFAEAAAAAVGVPTTFRLEAEHSSNSALQENEIFRQNVVFENITVADADGGNGLPFLGGPGGVLDIRVPAIRTGGNDVGLDQTTPQFDLLKYPGLDRNVTVLAGIEARLIEAEAALEAGDPTTWLQGLNNLRSSVATLLTQDHLDILDQVFGITGPAVQLAPLVDPGTPDTRVDLHFAERAFWLFATAARFNDLRRLIRQYGRDPDAVLPTGVYFRGGAYGTDESFPVPFDETGNPNFTGCIDRGA